MHLLFLSRWFPYPPNNGSKIRIFNILKQLSGEHDLDLISFGEPRELTDADAVGVLKRYCRSVSGVPYRGFRPTSARALTGFLSGQPRSLVDTFSPQMQAAVVSRVSAHGYDLVVASELEMVPYALKVDGVPALFEDPELGSLLTEKERVTSIIERARLELTWLKLSRYLQQTLPRFAACTVVSEQEKANVHRAVPGYDAVEVVPNAVDLDSYQGSYGPPCPNSLVFAGALTYHANFDALRYFLVEIFPRVADVENRCVVRVTGSTTGVDTSALPTHPGVRYTGYVPDIGSVVAQSWASVVPLRVGAGTRLKILESMALGTPVVSTSKGAEGLDVTEGENILIADDPGEFAEKLINLLRSPRIRARLAAEGRSLVDARYSWDVVGPKLGSIVRRAAS